MNKQVDVKIAIVFFATFFYGNSNCFAQTKLSILYKSGGIKGSLQEYQKNTNNNKWSGKFSIEEFAISDTITYYETIENFEEKDEFAVKTIRKNRRNKVMGKNFIPHSKYCNYNKGISIEAIEWKDENYLVKDTLNNKQKIWGLSDETKVVLGYPCKKAYTMDNGQIDLIVWYTDNFKCNYSNDGDTSLSGTILESYYPKNNTLVTAIDLQIETSPITLPKGIVVTQDNFEKIKKNKKS